eukprot:scaffold167249_cov36-Tisochrysis_lutea.AAC.3
MDSHQSSVRDLQHRSGSGGVSTIHLFGQHAIELLGLHDCAGKAVKNEAIATLRSGNIVLDDANNLMPAKFGMRRWVC